MSNLSVFSFEKSPVRTILVSGAPWFSSADVGKILQLSNIRASVALLDDDEKGVNTIDTPGGKQEISIVSESGLYALIFKSRRPEAKKFRRWVTSEVLPAQKTADKTFKLTDENFTHIVFNPLHKNGRHKLAISRRRHRKINDTECVLTMTTEINIRRPGFEQFDKLHMFTADRF